MIATSSSAAGTSRRHRGLWLILVLLMPWQAASAEELPPQTNVAQIDIMAHFCDIEPKREFCASLPRDIPDFSRFFVYMLIEQNAQNPFDLFSWQNFVALNWPADTAGVPLDAAFGSRPQAPRHWQSFSTLEQLFDWPKAGICSAAQIAAAGFKISNFIQPGGSPLIDRQGNYVVYDTRLNPAMEAYIRENDLHHYSGQQQFMATGKAIDFPRGAYADAELGDAGRVGAMTIKTAWRILSAGDGAAASRFFTTAAVIEVTAENSLNGEAMCLPVRLGLVGMHIVHRVNSGNGGDWIWTTFEHVDNAPFADNARGPNSIFVKTLFADNCAASGQANREFSFFDAGCEHCPVNRPLQGEPADWVWAAQPPYARQRDAKALEPAQLSRCWLPSLGTRYVNRAWQQRLGDIPWASYQLSTTQWKGANKGLMFPHGEVPRYLTNSTIESFQQADHDGSCLGCHATARSAVGQPANFTFLLGKALPP